MPQKDGNKKGQPFFQGLARHSQNYFCKDLYNHIKPPPFNFYIPLKNLSQMSHLSLSSFLINLSNRDLHIKLFLFIHLLEADRKVTWQKGGERWNVPKWALEWQMRMKKEVQFKMFVVQTFSQFNS